MTAMEIIMYAGVIAGVLVPVLFKIMSVFFKDKDD